MLNLPIDEAEVDRAWGTEFIFAETGAIITEEDTPLIRCEVFKLLEAMILDERSGGVRRLVSPCREYQFRLV